MGKLDDAKLREGADPYLGQIKKLELKSFLKCKNTPTHDDLSLKGHSDVDSHLKTDNSGVRHFPCMADCLE